MQWKRYILYLPPTPLTLALPLSLSVSSLCLYLSLFFSDFLFTHAVFHCHLALYLLMSFLSDSTNVGYSFVVAPDGITVWALCDVQSNKPLILTSWNLSNTTNPMLLTSSNVTSVLEVATVRYAV